MLYLYENRKRNTGWYVGYVLARMHGRVAYDTCRHCERDYAIKSGIIKFIPFMEDIITPQAGADWIEYLAKPVAFCHLFIWLLKWIKKIKLDSYIRLLLLRYACMLVHYRTVIINDLIRSYSTGHVKKNSLFLTMAMF